jgi:hypothetical protein
MLPTKFWFIWPSGFRGKDFLEIDQSETRIACGSHVCKRIETKSRKRGGLTGMHRQFLFLIGRFLKKMFSSETALPNEPKLGTKLEIFI